MTIVLPEWFQWVVVLAPGVPIALHLTGLDKTTIGERINTILPDLVGFFKKFAPKEGK